MFANVNKSRLNIERPVIGRKDICGVLSTVACVFVNINMANNEANVLPAMLDGRFLLFSLLVEKKL